MEARIKKLFDDVKLVEKVKTKLPKLFQLAELESSRAGKIGMEVGSLREKILVALLIYAFDEENVKSDIPITEPETDVIVFDNPISIKTITGNGGVKLIWTVDASQALEFSKKYQPSCDMLFVRINWSNGGGLYYIPQHVQAETLKTMGSENYIKLPKQGTNSRGVEIDDSAMESLLNSEQTQRILLIWQKDVQFVIINRWLDLWRLD